MSGVYTPRLQILAVGIVAVRTAAVGIVNAFGGFRLPLKCNWFIPASAPTYPPSFMTIVNNILSNLVQRQTNKKWKYYSPPLLDIIIGSTKCNTSQSTLCLLAIDLRNGPALKSLWLGRVRVWPCTTDWVSHLLTQIDLWTQRHPAY